jgi:rubrerythrin
MCSVGGPMDVEYNDRASGADYSCNECGSRFRTIGKHPMCPTCQSEDVQKR